MSNSAVGKFSADNDLEHNPPESTTPPDRSVFRIGDALLETAIAVTCVRVGHAHTEHEYDQAFTELEDLRSQREYSTFAPLSQLVEVTRAQLRASIDNQIQDHLHERMDAERSCGGVTLDEFLLGQK
jgi:hypothetical protein